MPRSDRPANHRRSILTLPGIDQDDIGEFYDRRTEFRVETTLLRYESAGSNNDMVAVAKAIEAMATAGS